MAQKLPITPTLLDKFLTCPKMYAATYITKESQYTESPAAKHGKLLHASIETYIITKGATQFPPEVSYGLPYAQWILDMAAQPDIEIKVEASIAMTRNFEPTDWYNKIKAPWMRGKADVLIIDHAKKKSVVVDWKTGKPKDDNTQAHILSLCAARTYGYSDVECLWVNIHPEHENATKGPPKVVHHKLSAVQPYTEFNELFGNIARYEQACDDHTFTPKPNGLCKKYCDVASCPHNPNYRGR